MDNKPKYRSQLHAIQETLKIVIAAKFYENTVESIPQEVVEKIDSFKRTQTIIDIVVEVCVYKNHDKEALERHLLEVDE